MDKLDLSGLEPIDAPKALDTSKLQPLDVSGLQPIDEAPAVAEPKQSAIAGFFNPDNWTKPSAYGHYQSNYISALNNLASAVQDKMANPTGQAETVRLPVPFNGVAPITTVPNAADLQIQAAVQNIKDAEAGMARNKIQNPNFGQKLLQGVEPLAKFIAPSIGVGVLTGGASVPIQIGAQGILNAGMMGVEGHKNAQANALIEYAHKNNLDLANPADMQKAMSDMAFVQQRQDQANKTALIDAGAGAALSLIPGPVQNAVKGKLGDSLAAKIAAGSAGVGSAVGVGTVQTGANNYVADRPITENMGEGGLLLGAQDLLTRGAAAGGRLIAKKISDYQKSRQPNYYNPDADPNYTKQPQPAPKPAPAIEAAPALAIEAKPVPLLGNTPEVTPPAPTPVVEAPKPAVNEGIDREVNSDFTPKPENPNALKEAFTGISNKIRRIVTNQGFLGDILTRDIKAGNYDKFKKLLENVGIEGLSDAEVKDLANKVLESEAEHKASTSGKSPSESEKEYQQKTAKRYGVETEVAQLESKKPADRAKYIEELERIAKEGNDNLYGQEEHEQVVRIAKEKGLIDSKGIGESENAAARPAPVAEVAPALSTPEVKPTATIKTPYFNGDAGEYTGNTQEIGGKTFFEIKMTEGHLAGTKKWIPEAPTTVEPTPSPVVEAPKPAVEAPAPIVEQPKPVEPARSVQTEMPGVEDTFNLTGEQVATPKEAVTDNTTDMLPDASEPAYVGQARTQLAKLESAGQGESPQAKTLRETIEASKPKPVEATVEPAKSETVKEPQGVQEARAALAKMEASGNGNTKQADLRRAYIRKWELANGLEPSFPEPAQQELQKPVEPEKSVKVKKSKVNSDEPIEVQRARSIVDENKKVGQKRFGKALDTIEQYEEDMKLKRYDKDVNVEKASDEAIEEFLEAHEKRKDQATEFENKYAGGVAEYYANRQMRNATAGNIIADIREIATSTKVPPAKLPSIPKWYRYIDGRGVSRSLDHGRVFADLLKSVVPEAFAPPPSLRKIVSKFEIADPEFRRKVDREVEGMVEEVCERLTSRGWTQVDPSNNSTYDALADLLSKVSQGKDVYPQEGVNGASFSNKRLYNLKANEAAFEPPNVSPDSEIATNWTKEVYANKNNRLDYFQQQDAETVQSLIGDVSKIPAEIIDRNNFPVPEYYVKEGDNYVFKAPEPIGDNPFSRRDPSLRDEAGRTKVQIIAEANKLFNSIPEESGIKVFDLPIRENIIKDTSAFENAADIKEYLSDIADNVEKQSPEIAAKIRQIVDPVKTEPANRNPKIDATKADKLDERIATNAENRKADSEARRGYQGIIDRAVFEARKTGKVSEKEIQGLTNVLNYVGSRFFKDVKLSIRGGETTLQGQYDAVNRIVTIFKEAITNGRFEDTAAHEIAHHLSRFLPESDRVALRKEWQAARDKYLKENPGFAKLVGDKTADWSNVRVNGHDLQAMAKIHPELLTKEYFSQIPQPASYKGDPMYKIRATDESYRLFNANEWFAETFKEAARERLKADPAYSGKERTWKDKLVGLWNNIKTNFRQIFGKDNAQRILSNFAKGRYEAKEQGSNDIHSSAKETFNSERDSIDNPVKEPTVGQTEIPGTEETFNLSGETVKPEKAYEDMTPDEQLAYRKKNDSATGDMFGNQLSSKAALGAAGLEAASSLSTGDIIGLASVIAAQNDRVLQGLNPIVASLHLIADDKKSPMVKRIANMFGNRGGNVKAGAEETYDSEKDANRKIFTGKLTEAFEPLSKLSEEQIRAKGETLARALSGEITLTGPDAEVVTRLKKLADEIHAYAREAGVDVGYAQDYGMPHSFDVGKVLKDEAAFVADATKAYEINKTVKLNRIDATVERIKSQLADPKLKQDEIDSLVSSLVELQKQRDAVSQYNPAEQAQDLVNGISFGNEGGDIDQSLTLQTRGRATNSINSTKGRVFEPPARAVLRPYYNNDPRFAWESYINRMTRVAEFARRFGHDGSKWDKMVEAMRRDGLTNKEITDVKNMVLDSVGALTPRPTDGHALANSVLGLSNMAKLKYTAATVFLEAQSNAMAGNVTHAITAPLHMAGQTIAIIGEMSPKTREAMKRYVGIELNTETGAMELARMVGMIDAVGVHQILENSAHNITRAGEVEGVGASAKAARGISRATSAMARSFGIEAVENAKRVTATRYATNRLVQHTSEFLNDNFLARAYEKANPGATNPFTVKNEARMRLRRAGISDDLATQFAKWFQDAYNSGDFNSRIADPKDPMARLARKAIRMEANRATVSTGRANKLGGKINPWISQDMFWGKAVMTFLNYPTTFREQVFRPFAEDIKTAYKGYSSEGGETTFYSPYERLRMAARAMAVPAMALTASAFLAFRTYFNGDEERIKEMEATHWLKRLQQGITYTGITGGKAEAISRIEQGRTMPIVEEYGRLMQDLNRSDDAANKKERAFTKEASRTVGQPALQAAIANYVPMPLAVPINQAVGSKTFREQVVDVFAGKDQSHIDPRTGRPRDEGRKRDNGRPKEQR